MTNFDARIFKALLRTYVLLHNNWTNEENKDKRKKMQQSQSGPSTIYGPRNPVHLIKHSLSAVR